LPTSSLFPYTTLFRSDPVLFLSNPAGINEKMQRRTLDLIKDLNQQHLATIGDPEIATRINSFEMAYRMQTSAPELMDVSKESPEDRKSTRLNSSHLGI